MSNNFQEWVLLAASILTAVNTVFLFFGLRNLRKMRKEMDEVDDFGKIFSGDGPLAGLRFSSSPDSSGIAEAHTHPDGVPSPHNHYSDKVPLNRCPCESPLAMIEPLAYGRINHNQHCPYTPNKRWDDDEQEKPVLVDTKTDLGAGK